MGRPTPPGLRPLGLRRLFAPDNTTQYAAGENITFTDAGGGVTDINAVTAGGVGSGILKSATHRDPGFGIAYPNPPPWPDIRRPLQQGFTGSPQSICNFTQLWPASLPQSVEHMYASMFYVNRAAHLDTLYNPTSAAAPAFRWGIYSCLDGGLYPGALLWDSGPFGGLLISGDEGTDIAVNLDLQTGWYFFAAACDDPLASSMLLKPECALEIGHLGYSGMNNIGGIGPVMAYSVPQLASDPLPATFPTAGLHYLDKTAVPSGIPSAFGGWTALP